jgi:hypothetical protein
MDWSRGFAGVKTAETSAKWYGGSAPLDARDFAANLQLFAFHVATLGTFAHSFRDYEPFGCQPGWAGGNIGYRGGMSVGAAGMGGGGFSGGGGGFSGGGGGSSGGGGGSW